MAEVIRTTDVNSPATLTDVGTTEWGPEIAATYDEGSPEMFAPEVLDPVVSVLAELAGDGRALEFAVGTGRVALPLAEKGVPVHGIELSPHMTARLREKDMEKVVGVTVGDMCTQRVDGAFRLYLVFNTIMNVTTQDEQIAVFENAAAHLEPGGVFVVEVLVPQMRKLPPNELGRVFAMKPNHVGIETFDDVVGQISWSHHWMQVGDQLVHHAAPYRYVWPAELDLMARVAGLRLRDRWGDWHRTPYAEGGINQIVVYEKPLAG